MSAPPVRTTESLTYTESSSSKLASTLPTPNDLPEAPIVGFDLQFGNLKDYLNTVSSVVNSHGALLKSFATELRTRVSVTDMIEFFGSIGMIIPDEIGVIALVPTGDDWTDQVDFAVKKLSSLAENVLSLGKSRTQLSGELNSLTAQIEDRPTRSESDEQLQKLKENLDRRVENLKESTENTVKSIENRVNEYIVGLERKFAKLEEETIWKLRDVQDLLKLRVNEQFVTDKVDNLEDKLKKSIGLLTESAIAKYSKSLTEITKDIQKQESDFTAKLEICKETMDEIETKLIMKVNKDQVASLLRELRDFKAEIMGLDLPGLRSELETLSEASSSHTVSISHIENTLKAQDLRDQLESLKTLFSQLKLELSAKTDQDYVYNLIHKLQEPKTNCQEQQLATEFWKFRENTLAKLKQTDKSLEKLSKLTEIHILKKAVAAKANAYEVHSELTTHNVKLTTLEKSINSQSTELGSLQGSVKKLQGLIMEMSAKAGLALVGRKSALPANCLSCGRGDANFVPAVPQVIGVNGRLYRGSGAIVRNEKELPEDFLEYYQLLSKEDQGRTSRGQVQHVVGGLSVVKRHRPLSAKK